MEGPAAEDVRRVGRIDAVPSILEVVCRTTGMGFAAVARVTETHWTACAVRDEIGFGLEPGGELKLETTICDEIRDSGQAVVIDHVAEDAAFCGHPTPAMYGFQSYISMPIFLADRSFFGTLCAIDPRPARLNTPEIVGMFRLFAELIAIHLDSQEKLERSEAALLSAREAAELREQFIAVLGHDLRNPVASIHAGAELLLRSKLDERAAGIARLMQNSASRMAVLINNLLDLARGRSGGGPQLDRVSQASLAEALGQVISEARAAWPERTIEADIALHSPVVCDSSRLGRLLQNLVANALTHGASGGPVTVSATTEAGELRLSVSNQGDPIDPDTMARLFQPFSHGQNGAAKGGLGLGLYIASEIATAHGGALGVVSDTAETRFTFRMPLVGSAAEGLEPA